LDSNFGRSLTVGVEEELMILDAETLLPVGAVDVLVRGAEGLDIPGRLKTELHASVVELNTDVCDDVAQAMAALRELRRAAIAIAEANGLAIAGAGAHPTAPYDSLPVVQEDRYLAMICEVGHAARRQAVNGLHVHVGVESGDACHERLESVLPWLPVVLAVSANSPYAEGVDTGMQSTRASVLAELPRAGAPPAFDSYAAWEEWVERMTELGVIEDYTRVWWDVRPNPRFGTLELRIADQPTALEQTGLVVDLLVSLVARAPHRAVDAVVRGDYLQNRWAAARHGLDAQLIHPDGDRLASARELASELIGAKPPAPEALRQLEVGVDHVAADLVARTKVTV
jgi:glutamate---cysteine ligase / carboxylate-amine ligase